MLAMRSKRTAAVVLQSFASGLPLGLVWVAIPDWMRDIGVDIRVVGLITLAQAPWTFKVLWAPLMDRYVPPFWGRRRGWMARDASRAARARPDAGRRRSAPRSDLGGRRAGDGHRARRRHHRTSPSTPTPWRCCRKDEQGAAAGARTAIYRAAYSLAGGVAISARGAARLAGRQRLARVGLSADARHHVEIAGARSPGAAAAHAARSGLAAVPEFPHPAAGTRDSRVRRALQARPTSSPRR